MFLFHFSSLTSLFVLLRCFCLSVSVGALDLDGDTRPSALGRLSHATSLKRGGSLRIPRSNSECHCYTHIWWFRGGFSYCNSLCFYLFMCHTSCHIQYFGELLNFTTTFTAQTFALPGSSTFFFFRRITDTYYFKPVAVCCLKHAPFASVLQHGTMKHHSECSSWRSFRMWWLVSCPTSGNFGYPMLMEVFLVR